MKGYSRQLLTFTRDEILDLLQKWNYTLIDSFDDYKVDAAVKALTLNTLGIDFLFNSDAEFKKNVVDRMQVKINYYFDSMSPDGQLINFNHCDVVLEIFPEPDFFPMPVLEN